MSAKDTVVATKEVPAPPRQPRFSLTAPRDPGFAALRRAARAAIVIPLAFALGTFGLHLGQNVIFIVFGCFALLVITDFGGLRPARARAYLTATAVGAVLVALGTLLSLTIAAAAAVTFLVALVISFARVFGGYFVAGQTGMLLAYIVATAVPAPASSIPTRVGAFALAGVISTLAGVFMWPRFERVTLCKQAAKACLRVADLVEGLNAGGDPAALQRRIDTARAAEQAARREYVATAKRPAGPARRDRALAQLLIELQRVVDIVERPFYQYRATVVPRIAERDRLADSTIAALRSSADVLTGGTPPDIRAVEDSRLAHRTALDRWAGEELKAGRPADQVLDGLDVDHTLRVIAYLTIALGSNAIITAGGRPEVTVLRSVSGRGGLGGVMLRVLGTIRAHLDPSSTVVQSSLRIAVGLAIAVVVANRLGLQHGFWVVLGTLQVLRSNALGTGRTTVQAISVVVGLLLWPRGVRRALAHAMARFYRAISAYLDRCFDHILGLEPLGGVDPLRRSALQAGDLAGEAFDDFVNEKAVSPLSPDRAGFLLSAGNHAILAADLLEWLAASGYRASTCAEGARAVEGQVLILLAGLVQLADRLALIRTAEKHDEVSVHRLRAAAVDCLRRWRNDESVGKA